MDKAKSEDVIRFPAQVMKVQTMEDGAIRLSLDIPEMMTDIAALLMECRRQGAVLEIAAVAVKKVKHGREKPRKSDTGKNTEAPY